MVLLKYVDEVDFIRPRRPISSERRVRDLELLGEELCVAGGSRGRDLAVGR